MSKFIEIQPRLTFSCKYADKISKIKNIFSLDDYLTDNHRLASRRSLSVKIRSMFNQQPKYSAMVFILSACATWKGHLLSQWPQETQSEAFFSSLE